MILRMLTSGSCLMLQGGLHAVPINDGIKHLTHKWTSLFKYSVRFTLHALSPHPYFRFLHQMLINRMPACYDVIALNCVSNRWTAVRWTSVAVHCRLFLLRSPDGSLSALLQESGNYEGAGLPSFHQAMAAQGTASYDQNQHMVHQPHHHAQVSAAHSTLLKVCLCFDRQATAATDVCSNAGRV